VNNIIWPYGMIFIRRNDLHTSLHFLPKKLLAAACFFALPFVVYALESRLEERWT